MRVLVAYGSTRGGTAGLAHMLADAFAFRNIRTEVRRASDVRELTGVDAVVLGGAVYGNRWHPEAVSFVERHRAGLRALPVWFFSSGPLDDSARSGALAPVPQVNDLARAIDIRGHLTFGGLLERRPGGVLGLFAWGPAGDFRDRGQVAEWVERIAHELEAAEATVRVIERRPAPEQVAPPTGTTDPTEIATDTATEGEAASGEPASEGDEASASDATLRAARDRFGIRRYLRLDDEESDEGLDLFTDD